MLLLRVAAARRGASVISDTERDGRFVDAAKSAIDLRPPGDCPIQRRGRAAQDYYSGGKSDPPSLLRELREISGNAHFGLLTDVATTKSGKILLGKFAEQ